MQAGSDDAIRLWVNGKPVHTSTRARLAAPDQDEVELALQAGWNTVLVEVVHAGNIHAFYLRFAQGEGIRVARQR